MILIKEKELEDLSIEVRAEGNLDGRSVPVLKEVCETYLEDGRRVLVNLEGLFHISREGRDFLNGIKEKVLIVKSTNLL